MNIHEALASTVLFIASRRKAADSAGRDEAEALWRYVRVLVHFVQVTGQVYRFEDSLEETAPTQHPHVSAGLNARKGTFAHRAVELLLETLDAISEPEQKKHVLVLIALLDFIAETGQIDDVEDFFIHHLDDAPVAIAHFTSQEEAKAWLRDLAEPPSPARVLIGDDYHQFWYMREDNTRNMYRDHVIESAMESLAARGIPPQTPSFARRVEAEAWLMSHPANPYAFVAIAGEYYFAVHHRRLKRHSLHHVASALKAWEERKRAVEAADRPD